MCRTFCVTSTRDTRMSLVRNHLLFLMKNANHRRHCCHDIFSLVLWWWSKTLLPTVPLRQQDTIQITFKFGLAHYSDTTMGAMTSHITGVSIVCPTIWSGAHQRKHHSSASPTFVSGVQRSAVDSPHKGPITRKMFPFDNVIMSGQERWVGVCMGRWVGGLVNG